MSIATMPLTQAVDKFGIATDSGLLLDSARHALDAVDEVALQVRRFTRDV